MDFETTEMPQKSKNVKNFEFEIKFETPMDMDWNYELRNLRTW